MASMSTPKKKKSDAPAAKSRGTVFNLRVGRLEPLLDAYVNAQDVPPDKTAVIYKALERFLAERGYTLPADGKG